MGLTLYGNIEELPTDLSLYHNVYLQETCGDMIDMIVTFDGRVLVLMDLLISRKGKLHGNKTRNVKYI